MSQAPITAPVRARVAPRSNVYTVLAAIAALALAVACGVVAYTSTQHSGQGNPFFLEPKN